MAHWRKEFSCTKHEQSNNNKVPHPQEPHPSINQPPIFGMNVIVTGAKGQLGQTLLRVLRRETDWALSAMTRSHFFTLGTMSSINPLSKASWREALATTGWHPDVIINAAAMTNVNHCETHREEAWQSNAQLAETVTQVARIFDARVVQISTDYVFDGVAGPYTEEHKPNPINYYGRTKLAAENICAHSGVHAAIVRTMWLYGYTDGLKMNFPEWVRDRLSNETHIDVINDEFGNPTLMEDLAYAVFQIIEKNISGIINVAGTERMSRLELAMAVAEAFELDSTFIHSVTADELGRTAPRPMRSGLITLKAKSLIGLQARSLKDGLMMTRTARNRNML
ncbi:MAG: dTDP-4-dehydrorhamnose reductase [Chloroflexi bacterium OLB15]|nr:MAG: dTDP-4-dehydrorhamnose reductase [Chloroflexi bacterium OLB15]